MRACQEVLQRFKAHYPDFLGARIIFTVHRLESVKQCFFWVWTNYQRAISCVCVCFRGLNSTQAVDVVKEAMSLQRNFPDIMAGFDFVSTVQTPNAITNTL